MLIKIDLAGPRESKWHEHALRFATGGLITVGAGAIAKAFGPSIGGVFLAYPAIVPATVTLLAKHEREKKAGKGLHGTERGINAAGLDAFGSALGSIGLIAFAMTG
jgi:hypothetical protein